MSTQQCEEILPEGPPWKIIGKFLTFEEADRKREEISAQPDLQIKVHYQGAANKRYFAVKTRIDPAIAIEEAASARREEKKRRKARLNKKRRKK